MSGVIVPLYPIVRPFGNSAVGSANPGGATLPIPVPTQAGIIVGAASFVDGFPATTMIDPETSGGVPPFGQDVNGLLYMITQYCALLQAGELCAYNATASTAFGGYALGATLASVTVPGLKWINQVDGNVNNPDTTPAGWAADQPLYAASSATAGTYNNLVLPGASDFAFDFDTTAGDITLTGFVPQRNGQTIYASNIGTGLLNVSANGAGSSAANRVRAATDLAVIQNQTMSIKYFSTLNRWLAI